MKIKLISNMFPNHSISKSSHSYSKSSSEFNFSFPSKTPPEKVNLNLQFFHNFLSSMAPMISLPSLLLISSIFHSFFIQSTFSITLGSSITAGSNNSWLSQSRDFAFGFYPLPNGLFLLGIWFDSIPQKTLIWSANRDNPAPPNSAVELQNSGQFLISFPNGTFQQIYSQTPVSSASMENNGNFILKDANSITLWGSFDFPTDTIVAGQTLGVGMKLVSSKNVSDYSTGNFMLEMQRDGNLVLSNFHFSNAGYWFQIGLILNSVLVFDNNTSFLYLINGTGPIIRNFTQNIPTPVQDYHHRATISIHGDFQQFVYHKTNGANWIKVWTAMAEPCLVNTVCGLNGLCNSPDNDTVNCDCLLGFVHLDPDDTRKGCRTETALNYCSRDTRMNFTIHVIDDIDMDLPLDVEPFADLARTDFIDIERCKDEILNDCYAMAAVFKGSMCRKKRTPLMNARNSSTTKGTKALIKVPFPIVSEKPAVKNEGNYRKFLQIGNIVAGVVAFCFGFTALFYHPVVRTLVKKKRVLTASAIGINFREFTFQELVKATNGFNKILGSGSSGTVFRGNLHVVDSNSDVEIAVKRLDKTKERTEKEFVTELRIIGRTYHRNLVRLLGYCVENEKHLLLVYELMPNKTLSGFLFGNGERGSPNWNQRIEIAVGIASGLAYLHEECETQIIHCDVKPQNVLLDANYVAKISDFGLSKLLNKDQTRTDTAARGTAGYMAPEWLRGAPVTAKVDVYSYGVMLLEIICKRRHVELDRIEEESEEDDLVLSNWVLKCTAAGNLATVVGDDEEVLSDFGRFERMAMVGLWCIHPDALLRPSMKKVTQMLEGNMDVGIPPLLL